MTFNFAKGLIPLFLVSVTAAFAATGDGSPSDANILYYGRWDKSAATNYHSHWGAAYFRVSFTGTHVKVKLAAKADIMYSLDGGTSVKKAGATGTVDLTPSALASKTHTLWVAARGQTDELQFQGLVLDGGSNTVASTPTKGILEFIGNSITCGEQSSNALITAFPWLTGETLGYDHTQICFGGITLVNGYHYTYDGAPMIGQAVSYFKAKPPKRVNTTYDNIDPDWDFSAYTPKGVIINLGTNDRSTGVPSATFKSTYIDFVKAIRAKFPNAEIFVVRTYGGYLATETEAVAATFTTSDTKVHYINTTGWLTTSDYGSDGLHPSTAGHVKAATKLSDALKPFLNASTSVVRKPGKNISGAVQRASWKGRDAKGKRLIHSLTNELR